VTHYNQSTQETYSSDDIDKPDLVEPIRSCEVLGMKCDLKGTTSSTERFYVGAPCQTRDEQPGNKEQNPTEQQEEVQDKVRHRCPQRLMYAA
jgi:hypothetical protein